MLALHVTSKGSPEEKLSWAFRMYDVDGNGSIEFAEMKRVVGAVYEMLGTEAGTTGKAQVSRKALWCLIPSLAGAICQNGPELGWVCLAGRIHFCVQTGQGLAQHSAGALVKILLTVITCLLLFSLYCLQK